MTLPPGSKSQLKQPNSLRVLFAGMLGEMSRRPLATLLANHVPVGGVIVTAAVVPPYFFEEDGRSTPITRLKANYAVPTLSLPVTGADAPDLLALAARHDIPVYAVRRLDDGQTIAALSQLQADVLVVSCFNQKFPPALLDRFPYGGLNLHPSLLPHFRGPAPLFWTLRAGQVETGLTIHFMDDGWDTGDIALQQRIHLPEGIDGVDLERWTATKGSELLLTAVRRLSQGTLPRRPQPAGGSYQPLPTPADFGLDIIWSARHAFNFMRGTSHWSRPYWVEAGGERYGLQTAVSYKPEAKLPQPVVRQGKLWAVQFSPGVLLATPVDVPSAQMI